MPFISCYEASFFLTFYEEKYSLMKISITLSILLLLSVAASATIRTVSNNQDRPAQFVLTGFLVTSQIRNNGNPAAENITLFQNNINTIFIHNPDFIGISAHNLIIYNNLTSTIYGGISASTSSLSSTITIPTFNLSITSPINPISI